MVTDLWFNKARSGETMMNKNFMESCFQELQTEHFDFPGTWNKPVSVETMEYVDLFASGKETWDYKHETINTGKCMDSFFSKHLNISVITHSLFTPIGFDKAIFDRSGRFALKPHLGPSVNNREIREENLVGTVPTRANGTKDTSGSLFDYINCFGEDERDDDALLITSAMTVAAKKINRPLRNDTPDVSFAPFNDLMFESKNASSKTVDKFIDQTILGDPVAAPATKKDIYDLFFKLTGKVFDEVFKLVNTKGPHAPSPEDVPDDIMAVICLVEIIKLFNDSHDYKNNINTMFGRQRLWSVLMNNVFGKQAMVGLVEFSKTLDANDACNLRNLVLPENPYEMNLRIMWLFNYITPVTMLGVEGQKRKIATIYALLGIRPRMYILAFHKIGDENRAQLPNVSKNIDHSEFQQEMYLLGKRYFTRSSVKINTTLYSLKHSARGITKEQMKQVRKASSNAAKANENIDPKSVAEILAEMISNNTKRSASYSMNCVRKFSDAELKKKPTIKASGKFYTCEQGCEKSVIEQIEFTRRLFFIMVNEVNLDVNCPELLKSLFKDFTDQVKTWVNGGVLEKLDSSKKSMNEKKQKEMSDAWTKFFEAFEKEETINEYLADIEYGFAHVHPRPDCIFQYKVIESEAGEVDKLDFDQNCGNIRKPEFWIGLWLCNHPETSKISGSVLELPNSVFPPIINHLAILFSHAGFSLKSMKNLSVFFSNNGSRAYEYPDTLKLLIKDAVVEGRSNQWTGIVSCKIL